MSYDLGPEGWAQVVAAWQGTDADFLTFRALGIGLDGVGAQIEALRTFATAVGMQPA